MSSEYFEQIFASINSLSYRVKLLLVVLREIPFFSFAGQHGIPYDGQGEGRQLLVAVPEENKSNFFVHGAQKPL